MGHHRELVKLPVVEFTSARGYGRQLLLLLLVTASWFDAPQVMAGQVLILNSFENRAMHSALTSPSLRETLERETGASISITEMSVDARWNARNREPVLADLLKQRQEFLPVDLVIAESPPAISFWLKYRDDIAPDAALIGVAREGAFQPEDLRPTDVGFMSTFSFSTAMDDILAVRPQTKHVLVVLGNSDLERQLKQQAQTELSDYDGITIEYTNHQSLPELQQRVHNLSAESAVYLTLFNTDANGAVIPWHGALELTTAISPAPVFGPFDEQMGRGIVGGHLIPLTLQSELIGAAAARILQGLPVTKRWNQVALTVPTYDWRELERWSIASSILPPDSVVRFRPEPFWQAHALETSFFVALLSAQALLIIALLGQRRKLRHSESSQRELAGRLINAHEDEHRRIARELHDDLSQRLAHLAIEASRLDGGQTSGKSVHPPGYLQAQIAGIGEDIHNLSYRLHPSIVDDLGIVAAVRAECERVRRHNDVQVLEDIHPLMDPCPPDAALCLYRICQESLNNAIRHAEPSTIEVHLSQSNGNAVLEIRDDGCGLPEVPGAGLGLSSMRERARLAGGTLTLTGDHEHGTSVRISVPLSA